MLVIIKLVSLESTCGTSGDSRVVTQNAKRTDPQRMRRHTSRSHGDGQMASEREREKRLRCSVRTQFGRRKKKCCHRSQADDSTCNFCFFFFSSLNFCFRPRCGLASRTQWKECVCKEKSQFEMQFSKLAS